MEVDFEIVLHAKLTKPDLLNVVCYATLEKLNTHYSAKIITDSSVNLHEVISDAEKDNQNMVNISTNLQIQSQIQCAADDDKWHFCRLFRYPRKQSMHIN